MKTIFTALAATAFLAAGPNDPLTGRWESKPSEKGNVTGIVFKPGNTFEGYVNKKPFVTGIYQLQDSTFTFTDNGCNGVKGTYQIIVFSNNDSLRFKSINDDCTERMEGINRLVLGRVK